MDGCLSVIKCFAQLNSVRQPPCMPPCHTCVLQNISACLVRCLDKYGLIAWKTLTRHFAVVCLNCGCKVSTAGIVPCRRGKALMQAGRCKYCACRLYRHARQETAIYVYPILGMYKYCHVAATTDSVHYDKLSDMLISPYLGQSGID